MKNNMISIIIPVYNVENYIIRCLESVIRQTYKNLEIILVDDGSTDLSGDICDQYAKMDSRINVIHTVNSGMSKARNIGLEHVHGEYIGFVDSDDWIAPDMYEYLLHLIVEHNTDISMCDYVRSTGHKKEVHKQEYLKVYTQNDIWSFFYRIHGEKSFYSVWNRLYKRDILSGIYFWEGRMNEDVLFSYEVYKKINRVVYSNQIKYFYFKNNQGVTRKKLALKDMDLLAVWNRIECEERDTEYSEYVRLNQMRAAFTLFCKGMRHGQTDEIKVTNKMHELGILIQQNEKDLKNSYLLDWKRKIVLELICILMKIIK